MATTLDIQRALLARGYDIGKSGADGKIGPATLGAVMQALNKLPVVAIPATPPSAAAIVAKQAKASRAITEIIIHCSATPEGRDVSAATIKGWHLAQGWNDIGYHYVVKLDGTIEAGRPEAQTGAHVSGHNTGTLGVVYVGGVATDGKTAKDTRTAAQKAALIDICKALLAKYPTIKKITGHNQYAAKACPSFDVQKDPLGKLI